MSIVLSRLEKTRNYYGSLVKIINTVLVLIRQEYILYELFYEMSTEI